MSYVINKDVLFIKFLYINKCGENKLLTILLKCWWEKTKKFWEKRKMQANDRQEQKVARRTYIAYALPTGWVVNITWLVDVFFRLFHIIGALDSYPFSKIYHYYLLEIDIFTSVEFWFHRSCCRKRMWKIFGGKDIL